MFRLRYETQLLAMFQTYTTISFNRITQLRLVTPCVRFRGTDLVVRVYVWGRGEGKRYYLLHSRQI